MTREILLCIALLIGSRLLGQVTVGAPTLPEPFSILQVEGNTGGVRLPRLTTQDRDDLTPLLVGKIKANGLVIYNTTAKQLNYWDGTRWSTLPVTLADNGLQLVEPLKVQLGGTLTKDTHIDLSGWSLRFNTTTGKFHVNTNSLVINNDGKVGIGTSDPQGIFHIDAGKDNAAVPTQTQLSNDIVVDADGKLGIGMMPVDTDDSRLQIEGPLTIKAGETPVAGVDYILATKDGTGQAKWMRNAAAMPPIVLGKTGGTDGEIDGLTEAVSTANVGKYIGCRITLPPGKWVIQTVLLLNTSTVLAANARARVSFVWSDTRNTPGSSPDVLSGEIVQGNLVQGNNAIASGITVVKNSTQADKTYYLNITEVKYNSVPGVTWNRLGSDKDVTSIIAHPFLFP